MKREDWALALVVGFVATMLLLMTLRSCTQ